MTTHHAPLVWPLEIRACAPDLFTTPAHERDGNPFERKDLYERTLSQLRDELAKCCTRLPHDVTGASASI